MDFVKGWLCNLDPGNKKYIENFGGWTSWNVVNQKTSMEMWYLQLYLGEIDSGDVDWNWLAQNRIQWWVLVLVLTLYFLILES